MRDFHAGVTYTTGISRDRTPPTPFGLAMRQGHEVPPSTGTSRQRGWTSPPRNPSQSPQGEDGQAERLQAARGNAAPWAR